MRAGRREAKSRTVRQCAKNSALPLLVALLCFVPAMPAAARHHGRVPLILSAPDSAPAAGQADAQGADSSAPSRSGKNRNVRAGVAICKISAGNVDLGIFNSIDNELQTGTGSVTVSCGGVTIGKTYACIMFSPDPAHMQLPIRNARALYGIVAPGAPISYIFFQMYIGDQLWGANVFNGDYGEGYTFSIGSYVSTSFDFHYTAKLDLSAQNGLDQPVGNYSNYFKLQMVYTVNGIIAGATAKDLCDPKRVSALGLVVNQDSQTIKIGAHLKPACGLITGGTLNFGRQYRLTSSIEAHSSLTVKCSGGFDYTVAANAGYNPDSRFTNAMKCSTPETCDTETIQYLLYDDAGNIWNSERADSGGYVQKDHMDSSGSKTYNLTAKTIPLTSSPPPGTYQDTIIFTLTPTANP